MRYRRPLLLTEPGVDPSAALAAIRCLAPEAAGLVVLARTPAPRFTWFGGPTPAEPGPASGLVDELRAAVARAIPGAEVRLLSTPSPDALAEAVAGSGADLVVAGPRPLDALAALADLRSRQPVAVLWLPEASALRDRPMTELYCVALGARGEASVAAFLRDHGDPSLHVTILSFAWRSHDDLAIALDVAGISASVEEVSWPGGASRPPVDEVAQERDTDLVVLARFVPALLRSSRWRSPVLVLPPVAMPGPMMERAIDVPDLVDESGRVRVRIHYAFAVGQLTPLADEEIVFVANGKVAAVATTRQGEVELRSGMIGAAAVGIFRRARQPARADPLAAVEQKVRLLRPGVRPLVLFDVELSGEELAELHALAASGNREAPEALAVRLRATQSCQALRARLRTAGLLPLVIDASAVLDEGDAMDVGEPLDAVRLARVATRLRAAGFPVAAIVHRGPHEPAVRGFEALRAHQLAGWRPRSSVVTPRPTSLAARLDAATEAVPLSGNRIELELDNATARRWLLEAIAGAREQVHLQVYMASDDELGRQVEAALAEAGRRGVTVRVLVDSLHGLHGSFGLTNPLLARLSARPGIQLCVSKPVDGVPSLEDLKQRDHRKALIVDGRLALLGGRNLAREYYTAFEEVALTGKTTWRDVPWLDAGARVEGPAVAVLERSFLLAWGNAGGERFDIVAPSPVGPTPARVVVHRGLHDARTLETYLALIETARSHVYAVNGFPLLLELQHALIRAIRRGVRVCTLFGHVTPTHGDQPFEGPWSSARSVATWLVHSRMDPVIAAGGEGYQLAVRDLSGWAPNLGQVRPHVHAKVMSVDGQTCAVGSANLDITAGYWESELMLVVEDQSVTQALERRIDELLANSVRVDRNDAAWQQMAKRREWMNRWPGVLSV